MNFRTFAVISDFFKSTTTFAVFYLILTCICGVAADLTRNDSFPFQDQPEASYIVVHTLNGEIHLVNRRTGMVKWSRAFEPVLQVSYNGNPMLIVDPIEGRLYEYSNFPSEDIFTHLDHSVKGFVRRSPIYYKNFLSFGTKLDFWMPVDTDTGDIIEAADAKPTSQCNVHHPHSSTDGYSARLSHDTIGLGRTHYNLLFKDLYTGLPGLNITLNTLASHVETESQSHGLQHVATTEPALLTFEGNKLRWNLPLQSPVVGLYAIWAPPKPSNNSAIRTSFSSTCLRSDLPSGVTADDAIETGREQTDSSIEVNQRFLSTQTSSPVSIRCSALLPASTVPFPKVLKRIAFTTYALDIKMKRPIPQSSMNAILEDKFNGTLDLALSLYVDSTSSALLYAIPCVAESSLQLRPARRVSKDFMLEGPKVLRNKYASPDSNAQQWSRSLLGLYELPPTQLNRWASNSFVPIWARVPRLRQITDENTRWAVIVPPRMVDSAAQTDNTAQESVPLNLGSLPTHLLLSLAYFVVLGGCVSGYFLVSYVFRHKVNPNHFWPVTKSHSTQHSSVSQMIDPDSGFLPAHFDVPDTSGWAGCSAEEAGQPEPIRFNLNQIIGHGANGTMVFAGTFGQHETAVKRIVRQPQLEKHWRREHAILLHLQHPNLVRCFWTGSTANFHYLVMQRCALSLAELLQSAVGDGFLQYGLTPMQVIYQFTAAVNCLHQNRIVHRDLKPSNILVVFGRIESRVVVGDFGLSRPLPAGRQDVTNSFAAPVAQISHHPPCRTSDFEPDNPSEERPDTFAHGINVLYDENLFSAGEVPSGDQTSAGFVYGTLGWMAPELCDPSSGHLVIENICIPRKITVLCSGY